MGQQTATPPSPVSRVSCTEVRADAAPAIGRNADQLYAIPRRLQRHSKTRLQCWVIVNSTSGKSRALVSRPRSVDKTYFSNHLFISCFVFSRSRLLVFPSPPAPARVSSSRPLTCSTVSLPRLHESPTNSPTVPRSPLWVRSTVPAFLVRSPWKLPRSLQRLNPAVSMVPVHDNTFTRFPSLPASDAPRRIPSPSPLFVRWSPRSLNRPRALVFALVSAWLFGSLLWSISPSGFCQYLFVNYITRISTHKQ